MPSFPLLVPRWPAPPASRITSVAPKRVGLKVVVVVWRLAAPAPAHTAQEVLGWLRSAVKVLVHTHTLI